ncbi:VOC family protein [Glaciecola sp. 1036]|uniref:VOC family protein n=1 Tax=Alteromonadaceae TaxID=72275 RepID=UPI003CFE4430
MNISEIRAFIPCKDYQKSIAFYQALGFKSESAGEELTLLIKDDCTLFLQNHFYNEEMANSLMFQLIVNDIEDAFATISNNCDSGVKYSEINHERWGKVFYLWGPSGELWHVTELNG